MAEDFESAGAGGKAPSQRGLIERILESTLWQARFLVLLAVLSSILGAVVLFAIATMSIVEVAGKVWLHYILGSKAVDTHRAAVTAIVGAVAIYLNLIAFVLLIFSLGTYKLFISKIESATGSETTNILNITSLDELKD